MSSTLLEFIGASYIMVIALAALAIPWVYAVDPEIVKDRFRGSGLIATIAVLVIAGPVLGFILERNNDPDRLSVVGRVFGFLMQMQITVDLLVGVFFLLLKLWPKAAAVALAAFREATRQPLFWILTGFGVFMLILSPFLPYFTFGEDLKMLKDLSYITIMFAGAGFGVLAAGMSINEEIEGRAAITVMSKPISRRNFLLGKFVGLLFAAGLMVMLLSWLMVWVVVIYEDVNPPVTGQAKPDPQWVILTINNTFSNASPMTYLFRGVLLWLNVSLEALPGFVISFGQVMVLIAIAVAFATRVPMIINTLLCLAIYFVSHLTPILTAMSEARNRLVNFLARVFNNVLPGLDMFDMGPAVVRYAPLAPREFGLYTLNVTLYAVIYTAIALLFGLILFEDRDLA